MSNINGERTFLVDFNITLIPTMCNVNAPSLKQNLRGAATLLEQITDGADIIHSNTFDRNFLHSKLKSIFIKRTTSFCFYL